MIGAPAADAGGPGVPMHRVFALVGACLLLPIASPSAQRATAPTSATVTLQGVVRSATGVALRGARVMLQPSNGAPRILGVADAAGHYAERIPAGVPYRQVVSKPGYSPVTLQNPLGTTSDAAVDVVLEPGAAVVGTVVDRFGDPMAGLTVFVTPNPPQVGEDRVTQTDERGEFRVGSLADGRYDVQLSRAPIQFARATRTLSVPLIESYLSTMAAKTVEVSRHQDVDLDLTFDAGVNKVEIGAIAVESFARDHPQSSRGQDGADVDQSVIEGWVTGRNGRVARGAVVDLQPVGKGMPRRTSTDADGHYSLTGVTAGQYVIWARADAFNPAPVDESMRPHGQVIQVRARLAQTVPLTLTHGSVVSGVVVDRFGDPVEGAVIELHTVSFLNGRGVLTEAPVPEVRTTDDRGRYDFVAVSAGTYYLTAHDGIQRVFFPDRASAAQAQAIEVDEQRDLLNVDLQFLPSPSSGVEGQIVDASGAPTAASVFLFESARAGAPVTERRLTAAPSGQFAFTGVPPGQYVVQAIRRSQVPYRVYGTTPSISLGEVAADATLLTIAPGETTPVVLHLKTGFSLRGHFRILDWQEATAPFMVLSGMAADSDFSPIDGIASPDRVVLMPGERMPADGEFETERIAGPFRVQMSSPLPNGWWLKSVTVEGVDATTTPITLNKPVDNADALIATDGATLKGRVSDERTALAGVTVLAFSTDPGVWFAGSQYLRRLQTPRDGQFSFFSLPPGDYFVVAIDGVSADPARSDWQSVQALTTLSARAIRVRLTPKQEQQIELRLAP